MKFIYSLEILLPLARPGTCELEKPHVVTWDPYAWARARARASKNSPKA